MMNNIMQEKISEKLALQIALENYEKTVLELQLEEAHAQIDELNKQLEEATKPNEGGK